MIFCSEYILTAGSLQLPTAFQQLLELSSHHYVTTTPCYLREINTLVIKIIKLVSFMQVLNSLYWTLPPFHGSIRDNLTPQFAKFFISCCFGNRDIKDLTIPQEFKIEFFTGHQMYIHAQFQTFYGYLQMYSTPHVSKCFYSMLSRKLTQTNKINDFKLSFNSENIQGTTSKQA